MLVDSLFPVIPATSIVPSTCVLSSFTSPASFAPPPPRLCVPTLCFLHSTYVYTLSHLFWSSQFSSVSKCFHTVVHQRNGVLCPWSRQALSPPHVPELATRATSPPFYMAFFHTICVLDRSLLLAQVVLTLVTLLRQPPECWGYKCVWHAQPGDTLNSSVNCNVSTGVGGHHPNRFPVSSWCRNCSLFPSLLDGLNLPLLVHFIAIKPYVVYSLWEQAAFLTPLKTIG